MIDLRRIKYESMYGFMARTSFASSLSFRNMCYEESETIPSGKGRYIASDTLTATHDPDYIKRVMHGMGIPAASEFRKDLEPLLGPFRINLDTNAQYLTSDNLRFCPFCIRKGEHNMIQQLPFQDKCHIHGCRLIEVCPTCGEPIPYFLYPSSGKGIICPNCGKQLIDEYKSGSNLVADDFIRRDNIYAKKEFRIPEDIKNIMIFDTKVHPKPVVSDQFKKFMNDLVFNGKLPKPDYTIMKTFARDDPNRPFDEGQIPYENDFEFISSSAIGYAEYMLEQHEKLQEGKAPNLFDLQVADTAVEQACGYIMAMENVKLSRRMQPRKLGEIWYQIRTRVDLARLNYKYAKDRIKNYLICRYIDDMYHLAYDTFMDQPYVYGADVYLDKLVPVLDYEVVIIEYANRIEIHVIPCLTDGQEYERFFLESHKHVSGFTPF